MQLTEIRINLCPTAHHLPDNGTHAAAGHRDGSSHRDAVPHFGGGHASRLRAFCSLTFDDTFVVRDVKLIEGNDGLFLAMPSRKLSDHCPTCREKNHLRARFCNQCGARLDEHRHAGGGHRPAGASAAAGHGAARPKLHADVAHPINARCRREIERRAVEAYWREVERSQLPGYVAPNLDHEDYDLYDVGPDAAADRTSADRLAASNRQPVRAYPERLVASADWQPAIAVPAMIEAQPVGVSH